MICVECDKKSHRHRLFIDWRFKMNFGIEYLKFIMTEKNWSQGYVAKEIGADRTTVNKWVNYQLEPSIKMAKKLAKLLDSEWELFFTSQEDAVTKLGLDEVENNGL